MSILRTFKFYHNSNQNPFNLPIIDLCFFDLLLTAVCMFADRGFLLFGEATYVRLAVRVCRAVEDVFACSFALKSHFEYRFGFGS